MTDWIQLVFGLFFFGLGAVCVVRRRQLAARNADRIRAMFGSVGDGAARFATPLGILISGFIFITVGVIGLVQFGFWLALRA